MITSPILKKPYLVHHTSNYVDRDDVDSFFRKFGLPTLNKTRLEILLTQETQKEHSKLVIAPYKFQSKHLQSIA